jgi:hypothetical protein
VAEWATRIVLSYAIAPSSQMDLTQPAQTAHLVETFVLPGIRALHAADSPTAIDITPFEQGCGQPDQRAVRGAADGRPITPAAVHHQSSEYSNAVEHY